MYILLGNVFLENKTISYSLPHSKGFSICPVHNHSMNIYRNDLRKQTSYLDSNVRNTGLRKTKSNSVKMLLQLGIIPGNSFYL